MCGIVGAAGFIGNKEKAAFQDLLIFSQVRGPHSTGVASVDKYTKRCTIAKAIGRPSELIDYSKPYDKAVDFNKKFMLGHNRYATIGKVNTRNAHPWEFDNIVGCHNGTIPEHRLKVLTEQPSDFGTDSECLLANIDKYPLAEVMKKLDGAWALIWYDFRDNTLNFLRNTERSLFYCYLEDRKTIFWASEVGFLNSALDRNGLAHGKVFEVKAGEHYKWELKDNEVLDKPVCTVIESGGYLQERLNKWREAGKNFSAFNPNSSGAGGSPSGANYSPMMPVTQLPQDNIIDLRKARDNIKVKDFIHHQTLKDMDGQGYMKKGNDKKNMYRGFRGEIMNQVLFENATAKGCGWCQASATWGQPVRFIGPADHICLECNSDKEVREICNIKG